LQLQIAKYWFDVYLRHAAIKVQQGIFQYWIAGTLPILQIFCSYDYIRSDNLRRWKFILIMSHFFWNPCLYYFYVASCVICVFSKDIVCVLTFQLTNCAGM
jgi:hypothetical protein